MKKGRNVLFMCNHNSARSQMAEALLRSFKDPRFTAFSAGLDPRSLSEGAIRAMNEIGIDISGSRSKSIREFMGRETVHHAIFLCSESEPNCPKLYPFANNSHQWRLPAPNQLAQDTGSEEEAFRDVRNRIDQKIREWLAEMDGNEGGVQARAR